MDLRTLTTATAAPLLLVLLPITAGAQIERRVSGELVPYFWAVGVDGDAEIRGRDVDIDYDFEDTWDHLEFGGSILGVFRHGRWVGWGQLDYIDLKNDDIGARLGVVRIPGELNTTALIWTLAGGYQIGGFRHGQTFDVMLGVRGLHLELDLDVAGLANASKDEDFHDVVLVVRPDLPLSARWRFNPTASIGAGDSELTWELWPQFEFEITDTWVTRVGYRTLHYDIDGDNGNSFDAAFNGFTIGLGGKF